MSASLISMPPPQPVAMPTVNAADETDASEMDGMEEEAPTFLPVRTCAISPAAARRQQRTPWRSTQPPLYLSHAPSPAR